MPDITVAGHTFPENGPCSCGRKWPDIRNASAADVDTVGIAHHGNLSLFELNQIVTARDEEDKRIAAAMGDLAR